MNKTPYICYLQASEKRKRHKRTIMNALFKTYKKHVQSSSQANAGADGLQTKIFRFPFEKAVIFFGMTWHRLDREKTVTMINRVKSVGESVLFSPHTSEAKCLRLPFYESFLLYRLTNYSSLPTFSMDFLSDGESFYYMDGSDTPIMRINQQAGLNLTTENVLAYLNFYYCFVRLPEGEIIILKSPEEAAIIDLYDDERREDFNAIPTPCSIEETKETNLINVTVPVLYDGSPMEALISVTKEGIVTTQPKRMLTMGRAQ